jgi:GNAT superfamily N-acetyltransferase
MQISTPAVFEMQTRIAESRDMDTICALFHQLGYTNTSAALRQRFLDRFCNIRDEILVAEADGKVLGVVVVNYIQPFHAPGLWAMISALVVDDSVRGKGVGGALLEHAVCHALEMGCMQIELSSNESRIRAHDFYLKHGFAEVRKRFIRQIGRSCGLTPVD